MGFLDLPSFLFQLLFSSNKSLLFLAFVRSLGDFPRKATNPSFGDIKLTDPNDPSEQAPFDPEAALRSGLTPESLRAQSQKMTDHADELQRFFMDRKKQKKPTPANEN